MTNPLAGTPATLIEVPELIGAYDAKVPDPFNLAQRGEDHRQRLLDDAQRVVERALGDTRKAHV